MNPENEYRFIGEYRTVAAKIKDIVSKIEYKNATFEANLIEDCARPLYIEIKVAMVLDGIEYSESTMYHVITLSNIRCDHREVVLDRVLVALDMIEREHRLNCFKVNGVVYRKSN